MKQSNSPSRTLVACALAEHLTQRRDLSRAVRDTPVLPQSGQVSSFSAILLCHEEGLTHSADFVGDAFGDLRTPVARAD